MCVSPKTIKRGSQFITVSCGHCYQCIRKRKLDWEVRISSELSVSDSSFFSLISYNPENLPEPMVADKKAIQDLIRRLRRFFDYTYGPSVKLKYFIVSEYGEMRNRLHYHAIFFIKGLDIDRYQWKVLLEKEWGKGFCSAYNLSSNWIHYAVKYMQKSYNIMLASRLGYDAYDKSHQEFSKVECSSGLKDEIPYDMVDGYPKYYIKGKGYPLPRSWYDKKFSNPWLRSVVDRNNAIARSIGKTSKDYENEYERQCKFLSDNPDCAEVEKPRYDSRKGLTLNTEFDG